MTSRTREVLTLQIGHYSNFVGTHWWNIQESSFVYSSSEVQEPKEINHDVLFREGRNLRGDVTYTPRLVAVDLKGSLNTLRQSGELYDVTAPEDDVTWSNDVTLHKMESAQKNEFLQDLADQEEGSQQKVSESTSHESDQDETPSQGPAQSGQACTKVYDLDRSVSVWSDFLRLHLHPKTVHVLSDYQHNNELHRFDVFGLGRQVAANRRENEELEDRVHYFLEECDHLQGLHVLADTHGGFGGLASSLIQQIQDDYGLKAVTVISLCPPSFSAMGAVDCGYRVLNSVLAYEELTSHSSAFLPLSTRTSLWDRRSSQGHHAYPYLQYEPDLWYHVSAMLAASLETSTLPYRLQVSPSLMSHLTDALTAGGRKILSLQSALPFPLESQGTLYSSLMALEDQLPWQPITPHCSSHVLPFAQSVVLRGIPASRVRGAITSAMPHEVLTASSSEDILQLYLRERCTTALSAGCVIQQPVKVTAPFPQIFSAKVNSQGHIDSKDRDKLTGVQSVPTMTSLQVTESTIKLLEELSTEAQKLKLKKFTRLQDSGVEELDYLEALNNLQSLSQVYKSNTESLY